MTKPAMIHDDMVMINVLAELMAKTNVIAMFSITTTNLTGIPVLSIICSK